MNIKTNELAFLFDQFEKRMEDMRYSLISIGKQIQFLFNLSLGIAIGSFGYMMTLPAWAEAFLWASIYFFCTCAYIMLRALKLHVISPQGLDPRLMRDLPSFCLQDLNDLKKGTIELFQDRIKEDEGLVQRLVTVSENALVLVFLFPLLTLAFALFHYSAILSF